MLSIAIGYVDLQSVVSNVHQTGVTEVLFLYSHLILACTHLIGLIRLIPFHASSLNIM